MGRNGSGRSSDRVAANDNGAAEARVAGARAPVEGRGGSLFRRVVSFIEPEAVMVAESGNPLLDLANMGFGLINSALGAMAGLAGASVGNNFVELIPAIGKGLDAFEAFRMGTLRRTGQQSAARE